MIARFTLVLALFACNSKKPNGETCKNSWDCESGKCITGRCESGLEGARCERDYQCDYEHRVWCVQGTCRPKVKRGGACKVNEECDFTLVCASNRCEEAAVAAQLAEKEKRAQAVEQERQMLEQAGAAPGSGAVEKAALPPGPGTRIRTVTITGKQFAIAACKADERLESGGCKADHVLSSYPSGHSELDTVGARWNCTTLDATEVTAFALCSKLP